MKILLTGATGMIGSIVQELCIQSSHITEIISFLRRPSGVQHDKLTEVLLDDFSDYSQHDKMFEGAVGGIFCLGVYTGQVADDLFKKITVDYAVAFAKALEKNSPHARMCLLSGQGSDRSEKSKTAFARYKGMAENQIASLNLHFHTFRPAYIYPVEARKEPNLAYRISRFLYPLIRAFGPKYSIRSTELAQAMFEVACHGSDQEVMENDEILHYLKNKER
jgi:uncharacterized protein YbjT (DUF2867 family)